MTMLCRKPFTTAGGAAYGCGQCMPCRYNRRRVWANRIMFEAIQNEDNAFVTLTYADDNQYTLDPKHVQDWFKRLRKAVSPSKFRYYVVGEYGDESWRPHYHAALFGFRSCAYGQSRYTKRIVDCCYWCDLVRDTWKRGHVYLGTLEADSAGYICGYVTKKMTSRDDPRLGNRHPEFARMSLKPGIGRDAMFEVADVLMRYGLDVKNLDVPGILAVGGIDKPLGRYLVQNLRKMVGKDEKAPQEVLDKIAAEVRALQLAARSSSENPSLRGQILAANEQKYRNFAGRSKIYKREKRL